jgi:hypothetical protein
MPDSLFIVSFFFSNDIFSIYRLKPKRWQRCGGLACSWKKNKRKGALKVSIGALKGTLKVCSFLHWGTRSKRLSHFCRRPKINATEQGTRRAPSNSAPTNSWTRTGSGKLKPGVAEDCHFSIYRAPAQTHDGSVTWEWFDHQQLFGGLLTSIDLVPN